MRVKSGLTALDKGNARSGNEIDMKINNNISVSAYQRYSGLVFPRSHEGKFSFSEFVLLD